VDDSGWGGNTGINLYTRSDTKSDTLKTNLKPAAKSLKNPRVDT
jgi:hypothetical protein